MAPSAKAIMNRFCRRSAHRIAVSLWWVRLVGATMLSAVGRAKMVCSFGRNLASCTAARSSRSCSHFFGWVVLGDFHYTVTLVKIGMTAPGGKPCLLTRTMAMVTQMDHVSRISRGRRIETLDFHG